MSIQRSIKELQNEDLRLIIARKSQELDELREYVKINESALEAQLLSLKKELDEKDVLLMNMTIEKQTGKDPAWNRIHCQTANNNENMVNQQLDENIRPPKLEEKSSQQMHSMDALRTATKDVCIMDRGFI